MLGDCCDCSFYLLTKIWIGSVTGRVSHGIPFGVHPASIMVFFVCPALFFDLDRSDLPRSKYCTTPLVPGNDSSKSHWVVTIFAIYDIFLSEYRLALIRGHEYH